MIDLVSSRFRKLIVLTCIGMLLVLLAGALVTNTGSGMGCGDDWPLCNGKFIPAYTLESLIEYSHRLVSGLEGLLVLAVFIGVFRYYRHSQEAMLYASSSLFFTILQALLGAAAVKWPQSPGVMALHFGFSLLAFASTMLLVLWAYRMRKPAAALKSYTVPGSVFKYAIGVFTYAYVVVYIGAFIRHTESTGGCMGWPLCNGEVIPELSGATAIVFTHRVAALILSLLIIGLMVLIWKVTDRGAGIRKTAFAAAALVVTQVLSGAWLTFTIGNEYVFIFTSLVHNLIISILFGLVSELCIRSWKLRASQQGKA